MSLVEYNERKGVSKFSRVKVGYVLKPRFWEDVWVDQVLLAFKFPKLYGMVEGGSNQYMKRGIKEQQAGISQLERS